MDKAPKGEAGNLQKNDQATAKRSFAEKLKLAARGCVR
jgi:hypothetical protein